MSLVSVVFPFGVFCFALLYWLIPAGIRSYLLLLVSMGLYFYADKRGFLVLLFMIAVSYVCGSILQEKKQKYVLFFSVLVSIAPLLFFKIITFQRLSAWNVRNLIMPLGLSYYSFKSLSYLSDVYTGKVSAEKNVCKYALFVSFFPEIFIGPIDRASNLLKQINGKMEFQWDKVKSGAILMAYGYFQKIVIADRLSIYVDQVYEDLFYAEVVSYEGLITVAAVIFYSLQIYFDFAGCTNIVRGIGYMLGFELPENFRQPYLSSSVTEFWRRWHMSLTNWLRDYVYIPLGGNRKGTVRKFANIIVVFVVCGIWHGVGIHFLIWGVLNALFQIFEALCAMIVKNIREERYGLDKTEQKKSPFLFELIKKIYMFSAVSFTWIFFRAGNVKQALIVIKSMFAKWNPWVFFDESIYQFAFSVKNWNLLIFSIVFAFVIDVVERNGISIRVKLEQQKFLLQLAIIYFLLFFTLVFGAYGNGYNAVNFIYQAF